MARGVLPEEEGGPGGSENDEDEDELLEGEVGDVQIVVEEEEADDVGDDGPKHADNQVDMQAIDFRKGHEVLGEDEDCKSYSLELEITFLFESYDC